MERIGLWWDMESCPLPPYMDPYCIIWISKAILQSLNIHGNAHHFSAYEYLSYENQELKQILVNCGIRLREVPVGNSYEIEKTIMSDVLFWAMDTHSPADIIFIVGNLDFSNVFHNLRKRAYNVFLLCPSISEMPLPMVDAANACIEWSSIFRTHESIANPCFQGASNMERLYNEYGHSFSSAFPIMPTSWTEERKGFESSGLDNSFVHPFNERGSTSLPASSFHNHPHNEWPKRPTPSTEKKTPKPKPSPKIQPKKKGSMNDIKVWLRGVVNRKQYENGYNISSIYKDFETETKKAFDLKSLGFLKLSNLMEELKDVVVMREVSKGCHLLFPVKAKKQQTSAGGVKPKASADDFKNWLLQMVQTGEFSDGCLMSCIYQKFEGHTGKILDLEYLGHRKLSDLVAQYSDIVSLNKGPGPHRLFPADVHSETIFSKKKGEPALSNMEYNPSLVEQIVDSRAWSENLTGQTSDEHLLSDGYPTYNEMYMPEAPGYMWHSMSFPSTEGSERDFQKNSSNTKSDSSITPPGSNVSEFGAQPSNCISEMSNSNEARVTELLQELVLTLQRKKNPSIGDSVDSTRDECLVAEAVQILGLMRENNGIGRDFSVTELSETYPVTSNESHQPTCDISSVKRLPDLICSQLDAPLLEAEMNHNPYSYTRQTRPEARMAGGNDMSFARSMDSHVESKDVEKIANNEEDGEKSLMNNVASPVTATGGEARKGGFPKNQHTRKGSMNDIKRWLCGVVNSEQFENGYNISMIYRDFENATGKALDLKSLGFLKLSDLIEELKDVVLMREVNKGCHLLFRVKENSQEPSAGGLKPKASECDFENWLLQMVQTGEFSQGCLLSSVYQKFEGQTGKILDLEHLGYRKLSNLVAQYSGIVSLNKGPGPCRLFPADLCKGTISSEKKGKEALENMEFYPPVVDEVFGSNAWNENLTRQRSDEHLLSDGNYTNYNEMHVSEETGYAGLPPTFPIIEASEPVSQKNCPNTMSDSSSTPQRSNVSELEAQPSNSTSEMPDPGEEQVTELIQQLLLTLQRKKKNPIADYINSTRDEHLVAEAVQIVDLMRSKNSIGQEQSTTEIGENHSTTWNGNQQSTQSISYVKGIPDLICSESDTLSLEAGMSHYPYTHPLQTSSEARITGESHMGFVRSMESNVESRGNKKNAKSEEDEQRSLMNSVVLPVGTIVGAAGKGLKSLREFTMWKKNQ